MTLKNMRLHIPLLTLLAILIMGSCNSKKDEIEETYTPSGNVSITSFSLKANRDVAPNLDSVFFAIDLRHAMIFNADSLPVSTDIKSLVPLISYPSTVASVQIRNGEETYDYIANPDQAIDFTLPVTLTLTAEDGISSRSYKVKVNVHGQNPSQLLWSGSAVSALPGNQSPAVQKTVWFREEVACFMRFDDGSVSYNHSDSPYGNWSSQTLALPFTPDIRSITAGAERIYALSDSGELFYSSDCINWNSTNEYWESITGPYLSGVTGIRNDNGTRIHTTWGLSGIEESAVATDFPAYGFTAAATVESDWSPWPTIFIYGGRKNDGTLSDQCWGFDGQAWTCMSNGNLPSLEGAMLIPYWVSRPTSSLWLTDDRDAWLIMGGQQADGTPNRRIWYSFDNGINWTRGNDNMVIPEELPGFINSDAVVSLLQKSASATDWMRNVHRLPVTVNGTAILWECPEIYIFGGTDASGATANTIWRAVFARYTFTPII